MIKRWNALPEPGGLYDQPAGLLSKLAVLHDVYQAHRSWRTALETKSGDELNRWQEHNGEIMEVLAQIREARRGE